MESALNFAWRFIRAVVTKYSAQLGGKINAAVLSDTLCNLYESACDDYMKIASSVNPYSISYSLLERN